MVRSTGLATFFSSCAPVDSSNMVVFSLTIIVSLELLRKEKAISSAETKSEHYDREGEAERSFLRQSIQQRSKFDNELGKVPSTKFCLLAKSCAFI